MQVTVGGAACRAHTLCPSSILGTEMNRSSPSQELPGCESGSRSTSSPWIPLSSPHLPVKNPPLFTHCSFQSQKPTSYPLTLHLSAGLGSPSPLFSKTLSSVLFPLDLHQAHLFQLGLHSGMVIPSSSSPWDNAPFL